MQPIMNKQTTGVVIIASLISAAIGYFVFEFDWPFLPLPLLSGAALTFYIRQDSVLRHLPALLTGSLLYGFLAITLLYSQYYLTGMIFDSGFPFWPLYNPREYAVAITVFAFLSFLGGLSGIIVKGFRYLPHRVGPHKHGRNNGKRKTALCQTSAAPVSTVPGRNGILLGKPAQNHDRNRYLRQLIIRTGNDTRPGDEQ
jgi:hypothetical protein